MALPRRTMTLAYVEWRDASYQHGEVAPDDFVAGVVMTSAGILSKETRTHVSLSMDRYDQDGTYRHTAHIPRGMVLRMKTWKVRQQCSTSKEGAPR